MGGIVSCLALNFCECAACMACSCCSNLIGSSLSQSARFAHVLIILLTFSLAIILGKEYPDTINGYNYYTKVDLLDDCNSSYQDNCIYRQLIYRASFSCFLLFTILAVGSFASDYVNRSLWTLKFGAAIGVFIAFWWADNSFFNGWAQASRYISFVWLLVQGLLFIDFSHDAHDLLMTPAEEGAEPNHAVYLGISLVGIALAILGLVYLFLDYAGCDLGMFFTVLTLIVGVLTTIISLLEQVGGGLLTPCLVFAYSVFMCWYALLSNPSSSCNPTADSVNGTQNGAVIIVAIVSIVILMYCVVNGTKILNIFNPSGEGVMASHATRTSELTSVLSPSDTGTTVVAAGSRPQTRQPEESGRASGESQRLLRRHYDDEGDRDGTESEQPKSSGTPHERCFFHVLLMLVSCYGAMILTNWGRTDGAPASSGDHGESDQSMWLKITSLWTFWLIYAKILHVRYSDNQP